jgi:hypothetical protein
MRISAAICASSVFVAALAATPNPAKTDFSGNWTFAASRSKNIPEMMGSVQITLNIQQTPEALKVTEVSSVRGREMTRLVNYDLAGKVVDNEGPMGDPSQTITKWVGATVQTTWTRQGAVAGTQVVNTETRSLSADGKTMQTEWVREGRPPMVMVFEKKELATESK